MSLRFTPFLSRFNSTLSRVSNARGKSLIKSNLPVTAAIVRYFSHHGHSKPSRFDEETKVRRVAADTYTAHVTDTYSISDAPNGGYLMYIAIQAAIESSSLHKDPLCFTAYYVAKASEGVPADLTVRIIGKSKSSTTVHVTMSQEGSVRSEYMGTLGNLESMKGMNHSKKSAPYLPPPDECLNATTILRQTFKDGLKISQQTELRVPHDDPCAKGLFRGKRGDTAHLTAWASLTDKRMPCLASMAFFCDALPPPVLNISLTNWVPTLEYTVYFWSKPTPSSSIEDKDMHHWLRTTFTTTHVTNGLLYCDGEIWSHDGKELLATSRQMARVLEPRKN